MDEHRYTRVFSNTFVCNDCGAFSTFGKVNVKHFSTCKIGESKKWERFYDEAEPMHWEQDIGTVEEGAKYLLCYCFNDRPNEYFSAVYQDENFIVNNTGHHYLPPTWFAKITDPLRKDKSNE